MESVELVGKHTPWNSEHTVHLQKVAVGLQHWFPCVCVCVCVWFHETKFRFFSTIICKEKSLSCVL